MIGTQSLSLQEKKGANDDWPSSSQAETWLHRRSPLSYILLEYPKHDHTPEEKEHKLINSILKI